MAIDNYLNPAMNVMTPPKQRNSRYPSPPDTPLTQSRMDMDPRMTGSGSSFLSDTPRLSTFDDNDRELREPRPKYTAEQCYFIWYWRIDKRKPWEGREGIGEGIGDGVVERYNAYFTPHRPCQGLQCRYYRFLEEKKVPPIRKRSKSTGDKYQPKYGMLEFTEGKLRFPWMEPDSGSSSEPQNVLRPWEL